VSNVHFRGFVTEPNQGRRQKNLQGANEKKDRKIAKKEMKNSTIKLKNCLK